MPVIMQIPAKCRMLDVNEVNTAAIIQIPVQSASIIKVPELAAVAMIQYLHNYSLRSSGF